MTDIWVLDPETGEGSSVPMTPEQEAQHAADMAAGRKAGTAAAQARADDAERLRAINDRARTDPAFAALVDIVLKGVSR